VGSVFGRNSIFAGVHVFTKSVDVPDDYGTGPRLVVLSPDEGYIKADGGSAIAAAEKILASRGDQPRQKRNRLIFVAPDTDVVGRLNEAGRIYLAWREIVSDISEGKLNLDLFQSNLAKKSADGAQKSLLQMVRESYKWVLCPMQFSATEKNIDWEAVAVSTNAANLIQEIENQLREEEWITTEWSPIHLKALLEQWYFKDGAVDVSALKVYQDTCHYLYLPRLVNDQVYKGAIDQGLDSEDFFGYASGRDGDQYLGFRFAKSSIVVLDDASVLVEKNAAAEYRERIKPAPEVVPAPVSPPVGPGPTTPAGDPSVPVPGVVRNQFYATVDLDAVTAKLKFAEIVDEIVQQFTAKLGVEVSISVEIQAKSREGFDEGLQRSVNENCNVLRFSNAEFDYES
jgi:uncharacterized protein